MKEEARKQVDELMDIYDQKREGARKRADKALLEKLEFQADFSVRREQIILPAMREIGERLKGRGHEYLISSSEADIDAEGREIPPAAKIEFYPAGIPRAEFGPTNTPYVSFAGRSHVNKVAVAASSMLPGRGGSAGPRGEFPLEAIDSDFVQEQTVAMLREVLTQ